MVMNLYYAYWLAAYGSALEAAQAGKLSTSEFTRVRDAILRAIDDDTDEGETHAE